MKTTLFIARGDGESFIVRIATPRTTQLLDADEQVYPGGNYDGIPYARLAEISTGRKMVDVAKERRKHGKAKRTGPG